MRGSTIRSRRDLGVKPMCGFRGVFVSGHVHENRDITSDTTLPKPSSWRPKLTEGYRGIDFTGAACADFSLSGLE